MKLRFVVTVLVITGVSGVCKADQLDSKQIVNKLAAAKEQFKTIDIKFEREMYAIIDGENKLDHKGTAIYRETTDRMYYSHEASQFKPITGDSTATKVMNKISVSPKYSKKLAWNDKTNKNNGLVTHKSLEENMLTPPFKPFFEIFEMYDKKELVRRIDDVSLNDDGNYVVKIKEDNNGQRWIYMTLNPEYNYLPIKYEFTNQGKVHYKTEFSEFKEVCDGIWVPFVFNYLFADAATGSIRVTEANINTELSDSDLDFEFPVGTYVDDKIAGIRYTVGEGIDDSLGKDIADIDSSSDLERALDVKINEISVSDKQLLAASEKGKSIIDPEKSEYGQDGSDNSNSFIKVLVGTCLLLAIAVIIALFVCGHLNDFNVIQ